MSNALYEMYRNSRDLLDKYEREKEHEGRTEFEEIVNGWREVITIIDTSHPQIKAWYERRKEMQKSFTREQQDFICYEIGDWYLMMKPLLEGTHNLGYMKEKLKTMICGDE